MVVSVRQFLLLRLAVRQFLVLFHKKFSVSLSYHLGFIGDGDVRR